MSLLIFPDEVLLDIFDYLSFTEIIAAFYETMLYNRRIQNLINSRLRAMHVSTIDLRSMTKSQFLHTCRTLRSQENVCEKIRSLTLSNEYTFGQIRLFTTHMPLDQMVYLKRLTLIRPSLDEYHILFPTHVSSLTHLTLQYPESNDDGRVILIDEMPDLIELTVRSDASVQFRSEYNRVERLTVSELNLIDLIGFSTFFPNLRYLDITLTGTDMDLNQIQIPLLSVLKLRAWKVSHDVCEKFIRQMPHLRELFYSNDVQWAKNALVDGYRCQKLIESLPLLEAFEIDLYLAKTQAIDICELAASFQNPFYLSKNWNIICETRPNSNDFHVYSIPTSNISNLEIAADSFVSSAVLPVDDPHGHVNYLKLNMTPNWPLVTRFFPNVDTLELFQINSAKVIPTLSILSYLNKSMFLSKLRKLILSSPCHFDGTLLNYLLQQSAPNINHLDVSCQYLLRLIKTNALQSPLPIRTLILRHDDLRSDDTDVFIEFFKAQLQCLSLHLPNNESASGTIELFLDQCQALYSFNVFFTDALSMSSHVQLCKMLQQRPQTGAELRPTNIRIWQK